MELPQKITLLINDLLPLALPVASVGQGKARAPENPTLGLGALVGFGAQGQTPNQV